MAEHRIVKKNPLLSLPKLVAVGSNVELNIVLETKRKQMRILSKTSAQFASAATALHGTLQHISDTVEMTFCRKRIHLSAQTFLNLQ